MRAGRAIRHALLAALGCAIIGGSCLVFVGRPIIFQLSMGSAYAAWLFLAAALSLGPVYAIWRRRRPVSTYVRRDIAIWSGIFALVHTGAGLFVHFGGRVLPYFFEPNAPFVTPRIDPFGLTNYAGLVCLLVMLLLLAISNNFSIRALGTGKWQQLQRLSVWAGLIGLGHAAAYQTLEGRALPFTVFVWAVAAVVLALRLGRHLFGTRVSQCTFD